MATHVVGQQVVLSLFVGHIVERLAAFGQLFRKRFKQEVDKGGIIQDAMHIGTHAPPVCQIAVVAAIG